MSLREYILRRQAHTRGQMDTIRLQTLPVLNAWTEEPITMDDFLGRPSAEMTGSEADAVKALRYDIEQHADRDIDWTHVDNQLTRTQKASA